jgi:hypothetical protein
METAKRASTLVFRLKKLVRYFQDFCEPAVDILGLLVVAVTQVSAAEWRGLDCPVDPAIGERFEQIFLYNVLYYRKVGTMNETPGRRTTVTSSFHEVSTDKQ